ncbi:sigma-70 family RNA polymerase sigma factor [Desulfitobacterium sp. THU1]|uniref:RNA polymerase sigma factor n=1 Tax=Desulfitobacterium sp. THU1 TaxID=3138072 RepID=UPI00311EBC7F
MVLTLFITIKDDHEKNYILNLYQDYYGLVRKSIFKITHDNGNIEDLVNDTFIKLIEKISLIRTLESCKLATYIVCTARSVAINFIRHRDVENKYLFYGEEEDIAEGISDYKVVEDGIILEEQIEEMSRAISKLSEKEKDILYFKYILEMDNEQLGKILGIAPASVRQYLTRSRRKARQLIAKEVNLDGR